jgi:tetratricopeptide (TPR) repeat protein
MQTGANQRALRFAERALASAQSETGPDPTAIRYAIAGGYRLLGDARQRTGDLAGAAAAWNAALAALPNGVPELPLEMDERATILERLQRSDEATHLVRRLGELGYRRSSVGG